MGDIISKLLDLFGSGWKGYVGGAILLIGGLGLGADYVGQYVGVDVYANHATTWPEVTTMIGLGLTALGIRHKQDTAREPMP